MTDNKKLDKGKPIQVEWEYNKICKEIRKKTPCGRQILTNIALKYLVDAHRNTEGKLDSGGMERIAELVLKTKGLKDSAPISGVDI